MSAKRLVGVIKPANPVSEMTDEELDRLAAQINALVAKRANDQEPDGE
jgi:hypothetical protein